MNLLDREAPIDPAHAAVLVIDTQNYCAHPDGVGSAGIGRQHILAPACAAAIAGNARPRAAWRDRDARSL